MRGISDDLQTFYLQFAIGKDIKDLQFIIKLPQIVLYKQNIKKEASHKSAHSPQETSLILGRITCQQTRKPWKNYEKAIVRSLQPWKRNAKRVMQPRRNISN